MEGQTTPPPVHYQLLKGQLTEAGKVRQFTDHTAGLETRFDARHDAGGGDLETAEGRKSGSPPAP